MPEDFVNVAQKGRAREDSTSKSARITSVVHDAGADVVRVLVLAGSVAARRAGAQKAMVIKNMV